MAAYYNENNREAAAWLRELIKAKVIADGYVDERDVRDVRPADLGGFVQCHFFAGIGVWSYALRLAGWSDDTPVWTGSCPCQPFSTGGRRKGFADERHLWPSWFHLVALCGPVVVFGEQVASKDGRAWLDLVQADMEAAQYTFGRVDLPAAGVGAPHIRQRLWFVGDSSSTRTWWNNCTVSCAERESASERLATRHIADSPIDAGPTGALAESSCERFEGQRLRVLAGESRSSGSEARWSGKTRGFWERADWIYCRDGKYRPVEPGTFPLAHGTPARVGRLRGYGNAIVADAAAAFIQAYREGVTQ